MTCNLFVYALYKLDKEGWIFPAFFCWWLLQHGDCLAAGKRVAFALRVNRQRGYGQWIHVK
jgi:hypothetical protein